MTAKTGLPELREGQSIDDYYDEVLEILKADESQHQLKPVKRPPRKRDDSDFSSGDHHIMQPMYKRLDFNRRK